MRTIFNNDNRNELINRINQLNESSKALWGKMNVLQMIKHCISFEEIIAGHKKYRQSLFGKLIGGTALKIFTRDDKPLRKHLPSPSEMKMQQEIIASIDNEKKEWTRLIEENAIRTNFDSIHPFFGKMTKEQTGQFAYKHIDHHLRQFGC